MTFNFGKMMSRNQSSATVPTVHEGGVHHAEHSSAEHHAKAPLPFFASPVDPEALKWLERRKRASSGIARSGTVAQFESETTETESGLAHRIFRKQHEASTLELFFDLFFVGNMAVFTTKSAHVDLQSLSNYVGFFAFLWTTWFHISMFDVRFYVDSVWTRFTKFLAFGAMTALTGLGPMYDVILQRDSGMTSRAFQGMAIVFFSLRMLFVIQYSMVLFYVRRFDKTLVPLLLTVFVYVFAGFGFLATWLQNRDVTAMAGAQGAAKVRVWYIIICLESCAIIVISSIWRILSFKHTHLVERVGLLTLIVMGEGILGLIKSTSYASSGTNVILWEETGIVGCAVLLIYMMYILYFDNVDHHRFGTIRQQIWTLLHFPLHVTILLTVEGSTALILWNAVRSGVAYIVEDSLPSMTNPAIIPPHDAGAGGIFKSSADFVTSLNSTYYDVTARYHYKKLTTYYTPTAAAADLDKLSKAKAAFNTPAWVAEVQPTLKKITAYYEYFLYQNFGAEGPKKIDGEPDYSLKVQYYEDGFKFVTIYFYIAAGCLLLVLAGLYVFGRTKMTKTEWTSVAVRVFGGMTLPLVTISAFIEKNDDSYRFTFSYLLIPLVAIYYLLVIIVDNVIKAISERHHRGRQLKRMSQEFEEESSYEMHKKSTHGSPELVSAGDGDDAALVHNAQKIPTVTVAGGPRYSELVDEESDTEYRGGQAHRNFI